MRQKRLGSQPAPKLTRFLSRGQADSCCHHSPPADAAPRTTRGLQTTPPALPDPGCPRSPLTVPSQAATAETASGSARPRSGLSVGLAATAPRPPPPLARSPLPPAPPPPSPAAAAATAAGSVTSAPTGPSLPHCAAGGGGRSALRGGKGGAPGGRPRPLRAAL